MNNLPPSPKSEIPDCDPRVQLATERTLLAWIRTGLALMAFGFVVARFALILQSLGVQTNPLLSLSATLIGIFMVLLGAIANAGASLHYRKYFHNLLRDGTPPFTAWSLAFWVAFTSAIIGVLLIVYLLLVDVASWNRRPLRPSESSLVSRPNLVSMIPSRPHPTIESATTQTKTPL